MKDLPEPSFVYNPNDNHHKKPRNPAVRHQLEVLNGADAPGGRRGRHSRTSRQLNKKATRGDQPSGHKRAWKKYVLIVFAVLFSLGVIFALYLVMHVTKISSRPFSLTSKLDGESTGRVNILLLGVGDPEHDGAKLSDTNIVLSLDTQTHQAALISLPRDMQVSIPGHGQDKINAADSYGDVPLARQTVENLLGIKINYYVKINFTGLKEIVDDVGGIDVTNTTLLYDPEFPCDSPDTKICGYRLAPGQYHLDGDAALKYARCRKGTCGSDFGRDTRQQQVLQIVAKKALTLPNLVNPAKFNALLSTVSNNVTTDLSLTNMTRLYNLSKQYNISNPIQVVFDTSPGGYLAQSPYNSNLIPASGNYTSLARLVQNVFTLGPIYQERPQIVIENGTTTVGIGGKFMQSLTDANAPIVVDSVMNAALHTYATTQIIDYSGGKMSKTIAYLQKQLGLGSTIKATPATPAQLATSKGASFGVIVILGADYATKVSPATTTSQ